MVVVMKERASDTDVEAVIASLVDMGMDVHRSTGASRIVLGVVGGGKVDPRLIELMSGVQEIVRITQPYKLASRTFKPEDTTITILPYNQAEALTLPFSVTGFAAAMARMKEEAEARAVEPAQ